MILLRIAQFISNMLQGLLFVSAEGICVAKYTLLLKLIICKVWFENNITLTISDVPWFPCL